MKRKDMSPHARLARDLLGESEPTPEEIAASVWAVSHISARERWVVFLHTGIYDGRTYTFDEIGRILGIARGRVQQIKAKGLWSARHPVRFGRAIKAMHRSESVLEGLRTLVQQEAEEDEKLTLSEEYDAPAEPEGTEWVSARPAGYGRTSKPRAYLTWGRLRLNAPLLELWQPPSHGWVRVEAIKGQHVIRLERCEEPRLDVPGEGHPWAKGIRKLVDAGYGVAMDSGFLFRDLGWPRLRGGTLQWSIEGECILLSLPHFSSDS